MGGAAIKREVGGGRASRGSSRRADLRLLAGGRAGAVHVAALRPGEGLGAVAALALGPREGVCGRADGGGARVLSAGGAGRGAESPRDGQ